VFATTFNKNLATVFERSAVGEFDDPQLALAQQAALARLRQAQQGGAAGTPAPIEDPNAPRGARGGPVVPGGVTIPADPNASNGANAGPGELDVGGGVSGTGTDPAADARELLEVRVRQGEARLGNVSHKLRAEYPQAASLASASTGTWDPATYQPRSREEATAFGQRMVIDTTEAAARLELISAQVELARHDAQQGVPQASERLDALERDFARQQAYVDKLATIVDDASDGGISDVGEQALAGASIRSSSDVPVEQLADDLRQSGASEATIRRVVGAGELAIETDVSPGVSPRLAAITDRAVEHFISVARAFCDQMKRESIAEQRRQTELDEAALANAYERQGSERALTRDALNEQYAAQRSSQHAQWLALLDAAAMQRRSSAS
jgi:hypothetical protein